MERLTKTSDKGGLAFTFGLDITCTPSEMRKIYELGKHLKKYEDTGLEPENCAEYKKFEDELIASGKTFSRLIELLKADKAVTREFMRQIAAYFGQEESR